MLDKGDLQAIKEMFTEQRSGIMQDVSGMLAEHKADMVDMLTEQKSEIMQDASVLMESKFTPRFNLLAEGQQAIIDKLIPISRIERLEGEVNLLKTVVRQLSEDTQQLKKAQ